MSLSIIAVVTGHPAAIEGDALVLVESLEAEVRADPDLEGILVIDHPEWLKALSIRPSGALKVVVAAEAHGQPARLFNIGLGHATGERLAFAWPGVHPSATIAALRRLQAVAEGDDGRKDVDDDDDDDEDDDAAESDGDGPAAEPKPFVASARGVGETRFLTVHSWLVADGDGMPPGYPLGWLQLADLVPMHESLLDADFARRLRFDEDPALQVGFWWEFCLRAARETDIVCDGVPAGDALSWWRFPFHRATFGDGDAVARLVMDRQTAASQLAAAPDHRGSDGDLPAAMVDGAPMAAPWGRRLRVTILGGVNEPAHNQLCFLNYFERLRDLGWMSWRTVLDTAAHDLDVLRSDLVIFSRVKTENGRRLMDLCVRQGVPTLYMIDDNWFRVAADVPVYKDLFAPDSPFIKTFLHCVDRADLTLTYNPILAEDLKPHAQELAVIETNIDLSLFPARTEAPPERRRTRVGYVGSIRTDTIAIDALCDLVAKREDLELFFMSGFTPEVERNLPEERRIIAPYVFDYTRYAEIVAEAAPEILLAPLGDTMFEQSKCPNKYLEITAAGAVGVYSATPLYRRYVKDGRTGYLNATHSRKGWRKAIERAIDAGAERRVVVERAHADVSANFATEKRMRDLIGVIGRAVELGTRRREGARP